FGLLSQASHSQKDRAKLANLLLRRGSSVNGALTKTYAKS
ncbi:reverse transcriptase, partial [Pseudomonas capsici]|nr:reverse transcriptase [Pseudomonas capsici]